MSETTPHRTDKARRQADERNRRLAQALKANIGRRKEQARARQDAAPAADDGADGAPGDGSASD